MRTATINHWPSPIYYLTTSSFMQRGLALSPGCPHSLLCRFTFSIIRESGTSTPCIILNTNWRTNNGGGWERGWEGLVVMISKLEQDIVGVMSAPWTMDQNKVCLHKMVATCKVMTYLFYNQCAYNQGVYKTLFSSLWRKICDTMIHHTHTYLSNETTTRTVAITSLLPICIHRDKKNSRSKTVSNHPSR